MSFLKTVLVVTLFYFFFPFFFSSDSFFFLDFIRSWTPPFPHQMTFRVVTLLPLCQGMSLRSGA